LVDNLLTENLQQLSSELIGRQTLLVTTPTVAGLYGRQLYAELQKQPIDISLQVLEISEETKSMDQVLKICSEAQRRKFGRKAMLVGLGGGVCTDLVTMAASLIRRGIDYIRIPTTLLGQVDGSIGVKGAVNFDGKKNSLGCYYSPKTVFVDPAFLKTLTPHQLSLGVSEIIKMALVRDARLFELVEKHGRTLIQNGFQEPRQEAIEIMRRAIIGMIEELETNMYEDKTYKRLVDFGHTLSPVIEAAADFSVPHGEAVAIGMAFCCELSKEVGIMDELSCKRAIACIRDCDLPTYSRLLTAPVVEKALAEASRHRAGDLNLVIPKEIGTGTFLESSQQIPTQVIHRAIAKLQSYGSHRANRTPISNRNLVFDIGGTNLRAAIYDPATNELTKRASKPTPNHLQHPDLATGEILRLVIERMDDLAEALLDGDVPANVTVAFAGPLNEHNQIRAAPTVWGRTESPPVDLLADLKMLWPAPRIHLFNDVTAAGYRYLQDQNESLCMVTVGSGIGNKVFINGRPFTGPCGRGGEIGHIVVDHADDAVVCDCGGRGHLGGIASGRGTLATARRWAERDPNSYSKSALHGLSQGQPSAIENSHIVDSFHNGDLWTTQIIRYVAGKLGNVLAQMHQSIGIERFVIFGGYGTALGEPYRKLLVESAANDCWSSGQGWERMIELGADDDDSGLLGAGRFATEFSEAGR